MTTAELEGTGSNFTAGKLLEMRLRTREAVHAIAAKIEVGMVEEDVQAMARELLSARQKR